jgi:hypothetical protein
MGEKIGKWVKFGNLYGSSLLLPLNMAPVYIMSYSWVIHLSLSHLNSMCHHTFLFKENLMVVVTLYSSYSFPSKRTFGCRYTMEIITLCLDPCLIVQCCQVNFMPCNVQGKYKPLCSIHTVSVHSHLIFHLKSLSCVSFMSMMGDTSSPPSTSLFLSTSTHHPGIRLRNQLVPWNLHASMAGLLAFDSGLTSLASDRMIP